VLIDFKSKQGFACDKVSASAVGLCCVVLGQTLHSHDMTRGCHCTDGGSKVGMMHRKELLNHASAACQGAGSPSPCS
jgi:hypothetical protein